MDGPLLIKPNHLALYDWQLEDKGDCIELSFLIPGDLKKDDFSVKCNVEKGEISASVKDEVPFLCGKFEIRISTFTYSFTEKELIITLEKASNSPVALFITSQRNPNEKVDPKSAFALALFLMNQGSYEAAMSFLLMAVDPCFPPAVLMFSNLMIQQGSDISMLIPTLQSLVDDYKQPEAAQIIGQLALSNIVSLETGISYMKKGLELGDLVESILLGMLYSPYEEPHGKWEDEEESIKYYSLTEKEPRSLFGIGLIKLHNGSIEEGKKLIEEARKSIPDLPSINYDKIPKETIKPEKETSKKEDNEITKKYNKKLIIAGTVAAVAGFAALSISFMRHRK